MIIHVSRIKNSEHSDDTYIASISFANAMVFGLSSAMASVTLEELEAQE